MFSLKRIENFNLWIIKIIIFIIPLIPLYISPSMMFPFITGKNFVFRILVESAAAFWLGLIVVKKEYRIRNSPIVLSVLTFTFIVGLADLLGVNPYNSFWSNFERMEGYITILHIALYFMIVQSILRTKKDWKIFFSVVLLVSVFVSLFTLVFNIADYSLAFKRHVVEYGTRVYGTIGNPPFLASYLLLTSFVGLILTFHSKKAYIRLFYLIAFILNWVVIYLTATRGVILSGIAGLIIFISIPAYTSGFKLLKRTLGLLFVIFIITAGIYLKFIDIEIIKHDLTLSRFASMFTSESVISRFDLWAMAWNGIKIKPILGWGQENFIGIYTVNPITSMGTQVWMDRAHNIVIEWLTNTGILGLLSYLAIFGSAFFVLRNVSRTKVLSRGETEIIFIALVVYFIQNLFTFDTINTYIIFFALLAYIDNCMFNDQQLYSASKNNINISKTKICLSATLVAILCFSFIAYYINFKPISQSRQIVRSGFSSPASDSYLVLLGEYQQMLSFNTIGDSEVRMSMIQVSYQILKQHDFDRKGALEFIQATVNEIIKEIAIRDYDLEFMTHVIMFFNKIAYYEPSFTERSEKLINKIKLINPEYQRLNMFMADVNILQKDYESAFTNVKMIVDKNPEKVGNQLKLALMAIYSSREEVVKQALENIKKIRIFKDKNIVSGKKPFLALVELHQLAQVYREMKRYAKALQYLEEIIAIFSEEKMYFDQDIRYYMPRRRSQMRSKIHIELAEIYLELNERSRALKELDKAIIINPHISEDVKSFIDSINNKIKFN